MGYTRKIIETKEVSDKPTFYTKSLRIDLAENFHLHYRNFRIEMSSIEFAKMAKSWFIGWIKWNFLGRPKVRPTDDHLVIYSTDLPEKIGEGNDLVRGSELTVELQHQTDYIHLHYRGSRIEFSVDEFKDFAEVISKSKVKIDNDPDLQDYPKRIGLNHKLQPEFRVTDSKNEGKFWIGKTIIEKDEHQKLDRDSLVYNEKKGDWEKQFDYKNKNKLPNPFFFFTSLIYYLLRYPFLILNLEKPKNNPTIRNYLLNYMYSFFGKKNILVLINFARKVKRIILRK